ncbi:hypothetical protein BS639_22425 [Rouxiella silvae]|uniref:Pentapeptide MXKDX repeat protein n=1 Tax=Rouxiella silvae TaxID=1646373 RepID=A0AA40X1B6_9GAMM|nr:MULTISPECIES: pentapeptide MXKDX repeat protein [Rouxiella]KAB7895052.1 pentapeptide MXKDX repeat protein [Rouxiella sp. S1S-2]KQN43564.1 hypothetical protein ASE93_17460 [Serratia sp. Leaf50]MBF6636394.1 pentapeptide MXKDX repeat protein [Rouxiella silvae]ORJ18980.1 hypothetical protein BS639_22425 [Rouxiella silvae]
MKKLIAVMISSTLMLGMMSAHAEDAMTKPVVKKDGMSMSKDHMGKDTMGKDHMGKDKMSKDHMGKDTMGKDEMKKKSAMSQ